MNNTTPLTDILAKRLKELRIENDLSMGDLESMLGLTRATYGNLESRSGGRIETALAAADLFVQKGYNPAWIFKRDNSMEYKKNDEDDFLTNLFDEASAKQIKHKLLEIKKTVRFLEENIDETINDL